MRIVTNQDQNSNSTPRGVGRIAGKIRPAWYGSSGRGQTQVRQRQLLSTTLLNSYKQTNKYTAHYHYGTKNVFVVLNNAAFQSAGIYGRWKEKQIKYFTSTEQHKKQ